MNINKERLMTLNLIKMKLSDRIINQINFTLD